MLAEQSSIGAKVEQGAVEGATCARAATLDDTDGEMDAGLPVAPPGPLPSRWSRGVSMTAWGQYRHTIVFVKPGHGKTRAVFTTTLPQIGETFRNAYHTWLPQAGHQPTGGPEFERYDERFDPQDPGSEFDLYIPIQ